jgi:hypothetical protein
MISVNPIITPRIFGSTIYNRALLVVHLPGVSHGLGSGRTIIDPYQKSLLVYQTGSRLFQLFARRKCLRPGFKTKDPQQMDAVTS